jgi:hypothetical protein
MKTEYHFERRRRENFAEGAENKNQKMPKGESLLLRSHCNSVAGHLSSFLLNFFSAPSAKPSRPLRSKMHFNSTLANQP